MGKNKGAAKSAQECYSAVVMDMTYMMVDFYWDILYLVMCVLGLVILALLLILWDLIGLLFTPLVQALGLGAYIKQVWDTESLPVRTKQMEQMVSLATEISIAQDGWLLNQASADDLIRTEQLRDICRRINDCSIKSESL